ncbi:peptidase S8/S53 domain-containing protein [Ochromonadaceae sp. CCMP2298]|nr:peptidase S8/S53 domain-containing protein [Ochromonadaceae sp. CCMP2298]
MMLRFTILAALLGVLSASFTKIESRIPRDTFVLQEASDPTTQHEVIFAIKQRNLPQLADLVLTMSTPGSPHYQQWMNFEAVGEMTANPAAATAVRAWLSAHNLVPTKATIYDNYITVAASISEWESLLDTKFNKYLDTTQGKSYHRADHYSLPAELKDLLSTVFNTVQTPPVFSPKYMRKSQDQGQKEGQGEKMEVSKHLRSDLRIRSLGNRFELTTTGVTTPEFITAYYEIPSNTGSATMQQSIFETNNESFSASDLSQFQSTYNLPQQAALSPYGFETSDCTNNDCFEGNLDVQYIMGIAQQTATIYWYVGGSDPFTDWVVDVANTPNPPLVNSMSWGSTEMFNSPSSMDTFNNEASKLAAIGVTVLVSSGDNGAPGNSRYCNLYSGSSISKWKGSSTWTGRGYFPSFPATSPYVTAVGASMGPQAGTPEIACQSQLGGVITTGGGFSTYFAQPSWQTSLVSAYFANLPSSKIPTTGYNIKGRAYPDVSMLGVQYEVVVQGKIVKLFGTSASAPVLAAMVTLINTGRAKKGMGPVGFINPSLYYYGADYNHDVAGTNWLPFSDITSGSNKCTSYGSSDYATNTPCCNSGFFASAGWDPVTGLGSVHFANLQTMVSGGPPSPTSDSDSSAWSAGTIGLVVGGVLVALALGVAAYYALNRKTSDLSDWFAAPDTGTSMNSIAMAGSASASASVSAQSTDALHSVENPLVRA